MTRGNGNGQGTRNIDVAKAGITVGFLDPNLHLGMCQWFHAAVAMQLWLASQYALLLLLLALCGHCPTDGPSCPSRCIFSKGPKRRRGLQLGLFSATRPRPLALANCELAVLLAFFFFCLPIGQLHKKGCQIAFTHTQHVMRNGLSASSNLDQKSLKSLINVYFYTTIFQISKKA